MPAIDRDVRRAARMRSGLLALGGALTLLLISLSLQAYGLSMLEIQLAAIRSWMVGDGLYAYRVPGTQTGAALSPALALLLAPLAALPLPVAGWLLALASLAALLLALLVLAGPIARRLGRSRAPLVLTLTALALLTGPVRATIGLGRTDLLLFALVVVDLVALRRVAWARDRWLPGRFPRSRFPDGKQSHTERLRRIWITGAWAGTGIGLATALTPAPVLLIGYLLISRRRRAGLTALSTAAAVSLGAFVAAPGETLTWYGHALWQLDRTAPISAADNQSLAGLLARLHGHTAPPVLVWLSFGVLLLAVGLIRARSAHADNDEVAAFTLVGLAATVAGPVAAAGEALWLLPAVLILGDVAIRSRPAGPPGGRPAWPGLCRALFAGAGLSPARLAGAGFGLAAIAGYGLLVADPHGAVTWNGYAIALIVLVNALPWRNETVPVAPVRRSFRRAAAIPVPRGG
ncbi:glycosyltransferase family 87 protein [Actinoplanes sp. DH11]|uniref:glycosyltransferase family 87 protein n=1 Tax=Actinoplanes sp. DH11 TaxID=2857011 RepID=UPI001E4DFBA9|nr:glycosyltransferase family 87 protein [Actinoplanes sp. DH11]